MDNLSAGYNFGAISHTHTNLRFIAGVQNVFVITKYKGIDPEISAGTDVGPGNPGIDNNLYPRPRTYFLGLNLDF
jgi:iron complex outermembrane receptor protein